MTTPWIKPPHSSWSSYVIKNARVPQALLCIGSETKNADFVCDRDGLCFVQMKIVEGRIVAVEPNDDCTTADDDDMPVLDMKEGMIFPTFVDLHCHIDKGHSCERSRNLSGSLKDADIATKEDEAHWNEKELEARMEFSLKTALAHGTCAIRTHLQSASLKQQNLTWTVFSKLREKWKGVLEFQGVLLVTLSFFRNEEASRTLTKRVKECCGILSVVVCCSEVGGTELDSHTTCGEELQSLLDRIFQLTNENSLDLDFHVDENGNPESQGLLHIASAAIWNEFK